MKNRRQEMGKLKYQALFFIGMKQNRLKLPTVLQRWAEVSFNTTCFVCEISPSKFSTGTLDGGHTNQHPESVVFGTWICWFMGNLLIGGLGFHHQEGIISNYLIIYLFWNHGMDYDFPFSWECHHPNWRTHTFQRGRSTTNQFIRTS